MKRDLSAKRGAPAAAAGVDDIVVTIQDGVGRREDVIIRNSRETARLEGRNYLKFRIINPAGFENEEIFHRPDYGDCSLLSVVFTALADASHRGPERKSAASCRRGRNAG